MPGMPEQKSVGTSVNEMVLGGQYLFQKYEGTMDGKPFTGGALRSDADVRPRSLGANGVHSGLKSWLSKCINKESIQQPCVVGSAD